MDIVILHCPVCPHCGVENVAFQLLGQCQRGDIVERSCQLWACGNCGKPACSYSPQPFSGGGHGIKELYAFYPVPKAIAAPYGTPVPVANAYRSAKRFLMTGKDADYEAACMMARRGIELAVNEKGGEGKTLFQTINDLERKRLIPPAMCEWAHHIREIGNDGAHGGIITREDAAQAVYFSEMLFTYFYSLPTRMAEYRS